MRPRYALRAGWLLIRAATCSLPTRTTRACSNSINRWRRSMRSRARAIRRPIAYSDRAAAAPASRPRYAPVRPGRRRRVRPEYATRPQSASTVWATCSSPTRSTIACSNTINRWRRTTRRAARATSPRTWCWGKVRAAPTSSAVYAPTPLPATRRRARPRYASRAVSRWTRQGISTSPTRPTIAYCVSTIR